MRSLLLSLALGVIAGIIDITPMIIQKLDKYATASAFVQWVILGFIITHINIPGVDGWLKGTIVAVLMSLPIIILVLKADRKSVPIILLISAILGGVVGFLSTKI
ncbi:MAG: hypothetical protein A2233_03610 [Candidatus Kerfeldbacteria bacterium RIFOXYA2_FULL_38_24]|uniref:Uncharacterized protein n=1 Tax=Candidatus Kerfeldbacteria bacterium RIFOXYB2_FULL_38_14 TaxID=1798547 RepID=A0A1G2BFP0_9BACT|nr:MAG: hypothetical protein A2233_03610 [Candidatus Kerfeldbacteria bacterium RIFOXYA2_FULL_38_24]OGY87516.1 MAG: hypothetical protein A2319_04105 [Candidatus Kerfeldbacteria bacterium RIFOXYB2_FULL_38_14]OGY90249.1 MAG: hypothetical protein A2458_03790 [Candidatus Kerfeldbacteria bacterium RIFOXYC2_FULL_38_9]